MDVRVGQQSDRTLYWEVNDLQSNWFWVRLSTQTFNVIDTNSPLQAETLIKALHACKELRPSFLNESSSYHVVNTIDFNPNWGLGTSSTFINNLAQWAQVDPMVLHDELSNGSGYDIACAGSSSPLIFHKTDEGSKAIPVHWFPSFADQLGFVYLNRKQSSRQSVRDFTGRKVTPEQIEQISTLTDNIVSCHDVKRFRELIEKHDTIMAGILDQSTIQSALFKDFNGSIKSLGAWGGDFALAVCQAGFSAMADYFVKEGYPTLLPWDIVLNTEDV